MASSCIPTGLRLPDLDMVKAAAAASGGAPLRPANSSASSAISDASNSSSLSLKRARTPRKRPNQTYNEAAALLASMYPSVFPAAAANAGENAPKLLGLASALADDPSRADLLPPFPVLGNATCLLRDAAPPTPPPRSPVLGTRACPSPAAVSSAFTEFRDSAPSPGTPDATDGPGELDFEDDDDSFDADSFLFGGVEDGAAEGIDGIMGKLSMESSGSAAASSINSVLSSSGVDPYVRNLMVLGLGFQRSRSNIKQALKRHDDDSEWWMCPAIPLKDIMPAPLPSMPLPPPVEKKKKTKKKALKDIANGQCINVCVKEEIPDPAYGDDGGILGLRAPKTGLGLSLNTEEVLKAWYDRGSVFADGNIPDASSTDGLAKLSDIELFLENGAAGAIREGGIKKLQHKQKQCTPLIANKTRHQARKVHAESRPRVKGRFVSQASLLRKAGEKESWGKAFLLA